LGQKKWPLIIWAALLTIALTVVGVMKSNLFHRSTTDAPVAGARSTPGGDASTDFAARTKPAPPPPTGADTKTKMQAASDDTDRKDYAAAEDIYKQVLKAEPNNVDAMKALASVLYREDKIEESAAVLDKLPKTN
jgi:predicted Zn-dependent protease